MAKRYKGIKQRRSAKFRSSKFEPILYVSLILAGAAAAVLLTIFIIIPFVSDLFAPLPTVRYSPSSFKDSVEVEKAPQKQRKGYRIPLVDRRREDGPIYCRRRRLYFDRQRGDEF